MSAARSLLAKLRYKSQLSGIDIFKLFCDEKASIINNLYILLSEESLCHRKFITEKISRFNWLINSRHWIAPLCKI